MNNPNTSDSVNIVFYDGVCGLCDRTVQFLLKRDTAQRFKFAPLQGETAGQRTDLPADMRSIVFVANLGTAQEQLYFRSEAVLRILGCLGGFWRVVSWLRLIPRPLRDAIYDAIATRRYRWFGKFDACRVPSPELRGRFLP
jgi:predicted DCC family thiol-disulfide oxidoreductase YuxK